MRFRVEHGKKRRQTGFCASRLGQALKARFLDFAFRHNPVALRQLATEVKAGTVTPRQWADRYGVGETWVEEWAQDVLDVWHNQPYLVPNLDQLNTKPPPTIRYPPPRDGRNEDDLFSFSISTVPTSKLSIGITMGGSVEGEEDDDWSRFCDQMHASLDGALASYRSKTLETGTSREVLIPKELLRKTEATAAYFFREMSPKKILPELVETVGAETTVYRWIKEIAKLLDLPMKRRRP